MLQLNDYLALSRTGARKQWRAMLSRPISDKRQDAFTPVETLLCFGLGLGAEPSKSGRVNIRESDPAAKMLAAIAHRPAGSLALKLANLDGRRDHGAKHEQQLWNELTSDLSRFMHLYEIVMQAARDEGIDTDRLPDFLGLESNTLEMVLDADRVSTEELRESIEGAVRSWAETHPGEELEGTERSMMGTARVGQKQFARSVLLNSDFACVFCGLAFRANGLPSSRMLIASHIKEWRHSESYERVDVRNGLAACPTHDAAFDAHLFTVNESLQVVHGDALLSAVAADPVVSRNFGPDGMFANLRVGSSGIDPGQSYLAWHTAQADRLATSKVS